jgi:hypothetical protein
MLPLSICIPVGLFIIGFIVITYKERSEKKKLSLEDQGRLSTANSKAWFWRILPLISLFACVQLFKFIPHEKNHLLVKPLTTALVVIGVLAAGTFFRLKALAKGGLPESYIQAMKTYAKARFAMFLILPVLVFMIAMLPLLWAIVINFFHPHAH